jgi:putative FmdB family regulatory protein
MQASQYQRVRNAKCQPQGLAFHQARPAGAPLPTCPACGAEAFSKQLTAAGFQLKGSGWYATDFKNSGGKSAAAPAPAADASAPAPAPAPAPAAAPATAD